MKKVIGWCLASLLVVGFAQAKEQMVTFHVWGEGHYSYNTVVIGNRLEWTVPCNACATSGYDWSNEYKGKWDKMLPASVSKDSIIFTVYRSEEVDQLISKLESNIAKLSDVNDALTRRVDELSKQVQDLRANGIKP